MSESKDSLKNDFWNLLNKLRGKIDIDNLKYYIITLVFLKHISDNNNTNTDLDIIIPDECDFQSILNSRYKEVELLGNEINLRLKNIAIANPKLDGVINFVDFNNSSVLGESYKSDIILGNIILFIEDYSNRNNTLDSKSNSIWVDLFDYLKQYFVENNVKYAAGLTTPDEVGILMAKLIGFQKGNGPKSIYDPAFGTGNLLYSVFNEVGNEALIYGEEMNLEYVFLAKLNFLFHGIYNFDLLESNVLDYPSFINISFEKSQQIKSKFQKFDYVVSNPLFGAKNWQEDPHDDMFDRWNSTTGIPSNKNADYAYILHIINSLKEDGTAACIVSNGALFKGGSERINRKYLVDNGFIKGIIGLPVKLFYGTGISSSIIILGNQPNNNKSDIFIIDASSKFSEGRFLNILLPENINHIADAWENRIEENEFSRLVSYNEIVENDYNLNIPRYLVNIEEFPIPADSKIVELATLLSIVPRIRPNNEDGKLIKISDLSNDSFLYEIDLDSLNIGKVNRNFLKLTTPSLLISKRFNRLKPSFCKASSEGPVYVSPEIEAFTINIDKVDLSYLIIQLDSEYVTKQIESFSGGMIMPNIKKDELLKIKIVIPNLESQDSLVRQKALAEGARLQSDKSKIESLQLQSTIDTLLKERMNDFQWKLHDIRNGELLNLKGQIVALEMFADINPNLFNTIVDKESSETVHSTIRDIYSSVQKLAVILSELYDTSDNGSIKEDIDILDFIKEFCVDQLKSNNNLFEIDYTDIEKIKIDFDIIDLVILANKNDLTRIFTNVFENAIRHGAFEELSQINKIKIQLSLDSKKEIISITILNNGKPSKINEIDYFADGGKAGSTSNSGKGGHIVKVLTERNNGKVFQNNYTADEAGGYTFEVSVQLKYKLFYEL